MKRIIIPSLTTLVLLFSACITDSSEDYPYGYRSEHLEKTMADEIDQIFYHGYLRNHSSILEPYEYSEDGFYLIESPEMLDSIFQVVNYPGIDTLFPENGVLLVFATYMNFGHEITDNVFYFSDSTLKMDLRIREWEGLYDPGVWQYVFPVGITFK